MNQLWAIELTFETGFAKVGTRIVGLWHRVAQAYVADQQCRIMAQIEPRLLKDAGIMGPHGA